MRDVYEHVMFYDELCSYENVSIGYVEFYILYCRFVFYIVCFVLFIMHVLHVFSPVCVMVVT